MRIAVIQCSQQPDLLSAIARFGMIAIQPGPQDAWQDFDGYVLAGADPMANDALVAATEAGKPVLGFGEGAAVLLGLGLVPGLENNKVAITLSPTSEARGASMRLSRDYQRNAYTRYVQQALVHTLPAPVPLPAFMMSPVLLQEIQEQGLDVFQYCDEQGVVLGEAPFNIAAIANKAGNVMAVLPHLAWHENDDLLLKSMHDYLKKGVFNPVSPLNYYPRR